MTTLEFVRNYPSDAVPSQLEWREHLDIGPRIFAQNLRGFAVWYNSGRIITEQPAAYRNGVLQGAQNNTFQGVNWVRPFSVGEAYPVKPAVQRISDAPQGTGDQNSLQPFLGGTNPDYIKQDTSFVTTSGTWNWTAPLGYLPPARDIGVRWYNDLTRVLYDTWVPVVALGTTLFGDPTYVVSTSTVTLVADIVCSLRPVLVQLRPDPFTPYNANLYTQIGPNLWRATWQSISLGSRAWPAGSSLIITPAVGDTVGAVDLYRSFRTTRPAITGYMEVEPVAGPASLDVTATVTMHAGVILPLTYDWDVPGDSGGTDGDNPHMMEFDVEDTWTVLVTVTDRSLRWTQFSQDVVVSTGPPTAMLESAAEASSATSVRVSALPPLASEAMMGSLRLTPTLAQAPPKVEDRSWLTRPRVEED